MIRLKRVAQLVAIRYIKIRCQENAILTPMSRVVYYRTYLSRYFIGLKSIGSCAEILYCQDGWRLFFLRIKPSGIVFLELAPQDLTDEVFGDFLSEFNCFGDFVMGQI